MRKHGTSTLTISRTGNFTVRTVGANHCGTSDRLQLRYNLTVCCTVDSMDARGFLFDQTKVDTFFQGQRDTAYSCEQYAVLLARGLFKQIRRENPLCLPQVMKLELSPAPYAATLTFEWNE